MHVYSVTIMSKMEEKFNKGKYGQEACSSDANFYNEKNSETFSNIPFERKKYKVSNDIFDFVILNTCAPTRPQTNNLSFLQWTTWLLELKNLLPYIFS